LLSVDESGTSLCRFSCNNTVFCVVDYAGSCAMLNIPGFTFPVRQFLLEDVLELLQSVLMLTVNSISAKSSNVTQSMLLNV